MQTFDPIPTVTVVSDSCIGFLIINESDFNPEVHTLYEAPKPKADKPAKA
jgi:hypothetical protein